MNTNQKIRTSRVEIRLTDEQKAFLQDLAKSSNLTVTEYIITHLHLPLLASD